MCRLFSLIAFFCLSAVACLAQIYVKASPEKSTFLEGEAVYIRISITNNSGAAVDLKSEDFSSWLDIHVEHSVTGTELPQSKFALFPPLSVPSGKSVSRKIDLRHFYNLSREGNYRVQAVVKLPNKRHMVASAKELFNVRRSAPMWTQSVPIPGSVKSCSFSVCTVPKRNNQLLYVQTKDPETDVPYNAVCIGTWLGTSRPQCKVDGKANLHVLFPTTPLLYAYARINHRGTLERLQYYRKVVGQPALSFSPKGEVQILGAVHYDPTVKPEQAPDATDIPAM